MLELILNAIVSNALEIVIAVISIVVSYYVVPLIKTELKPWLEEKRVYNLIAKFVEAAEKLVETGVLPKADKKQWVIDLLKQNGVVVDEKIEAFLESAVKQLDLVIETVKDELKPEEAQ